MENTSKPSSSKAGNVILIILLVAVAMVAGIYLANRGLVNIFVSKEPTSSNPVTVDYDNIEIYLDRNVIVTGYLIVPNSENVCFAAWPTCKLWLDNDPAEAGLGLHEAEFSLGNGPNEITTTGQLYDLSGSALNITHNDAFSWYHITITGTVSSCKEGNCVIQVSSVRAKP